MGYMEMKDRIRQRMDDLGLTQGDLAEAAGISQVMVYKLLQGSKTRKILVLSRALQCSPEWLETGAGPMTNNNKEPGGAENTAILGPVENTMPLIGWVKAGDWCETPDEFSPGDAEEWLPRPLNAGPRAFALRVQNDSMTAPYPGQRSYPEGTIIYVDPDRRVENGSRVVARANGQYTFKQYVEDAGRIFLKPINPDYDRIDITENVQICGVIIGSYLPE